MPENEAIALLRNCTIPWRSADAYITDHCEMMYRYRYDSKEQVNRCLRCTKSECDNCLDNVHYADMGKRASKWAKAKEIFCKYFYAGLSRKEICDRMDISRSTYIRYKKQFIIH